MATFWQTTVQRDWAAQTLTALALAFAPWLLWTLAYLPSDGSVEEVISRFIGILPLTALVAIGVYNALYLARRENEGGRLFATVLAVLGLGLIIGSEFLFIRDFFNNRGNTVFKLYYQAWILLAAASAFAVYYWLSTIQRQDGLARNILVCVGSSVCPASDRLALLPPRRCQDQARHTLRGPHPRRLVIRAAEQTRRVRRHRVAETERATLMPQ